MRYQISGKHIDIGDSLSEHVKTELTSIAGKYAERPTLAAVTFSKDGHEYACEASIHLSTGLSVNASSRAAEVYAAFDRCSARMEKQLRRYKRRLKDHHNTRSTPVEVSGVSSYILSSGEDDSEPVTLQPVIIAEMKTGIKSLSVGEAVMQMELADENVLMFRNDGHKGINVVYRRSDGNIGWIDPKNIDQ